MKLFIADGSNLLFQMFYGMPARIFNRKGAPVHGTLGFVGALLKMLKMTSPTHAVVLFDGEHEEARTHIDPAYKANRPDFSGVPEEQTPFSQLPQIFACLDVLGIRYAVTEDCETDDWIAGYAHAYREEEIVVSSFDSDFFQLLGERFTVLRYRGERSVFMTPALLYETLGISPARYADFKCLTGDAADNIKGVDGVGKKRAAALVNEYDSLENILLHAEELSPPRVKKAVPAAAERLKENRKLIALSPHAIPIPAEAAYYTPFAGKTGEVLARAGVLP